MKTILIPLLATLAGLLRSRAVLHLEILALRQQLAMVTAREHKRLRFRLCERLFWVWFYRLWPGCLKTLAIFKADSLVCWHREAFRLYWSYKSRRSGGGRPPISSRILYVLIVLRHERRQVVHFNITEHPTAQWTAQQIVEALPFDTAPRYLLRDRDSIYGEQFRRRVKSLGIEEVRIAPRSPWQNPYVERLIGSIRRECLNHLIVFNRPHLKRMLRSYFTYYHGARTHLALAKQCPEPRPFEQPDQGNIVAFPHVGGLHHEYRRAA